MKKIAIVLVALALVSGTSFAAERGTPEYDRLVALKKAQREQRERDRQNPQGRVKSFWEKEASRSGFAGTGAMFANAAGALIPLDKPNSRKASK